MGRKNKPSYTKEQLKAYLQWDVKSWAKAIKYWDSRVDWDKVNLCCEIGGREGGLSLWLAEKGKRVVCSDISGSREKAEMLHSKFDVGSLITYEDIDATNIPYENRFDLIVFKSVIGGVGSKYDYNHQQIAFNEMLKALKPGGVLLFAENLDGTWLHKLMRKRFVKWGNTWLYVSLNKMRQFLKNYASYQVKATGVVALFGRTEAQRSALASVDGGLLNHLTPSTCKYISYGIAKK